MNLLEFAEKLLPALTAAGMTWILTQVTFMKRKQEENSDRLTRIEATLDGKLATAHVEREDMKRRLDRIERWANGSLARLKDVDR